VTNLRRFDVSRINENLITFLVNANDKLEALDADEINQSILSTIESVRAVAESEDLRAAVADAPEITERLRETTADAQTLIRELNASIDPTGEELKATSRELRATLRQMQRTMKELDRTLSTDSGIGYQTQEALENLSEAAEAIRMLVRSLESDPGMFLRGREEPTPPPENEQ
jgi:paraquat-inducible protein B